MYQFTMPLFFLGLKKKLLLSVYEASHSHLNACEDLDRLKDLIPDRFIPVMHK